MGGWERKREEILKYEMDVHGTVDLKEHMMIIHWLICQIEQQGYRWLMRTDDEHKSDSSNINASSVTHDPKVLKWHFRAHDAKGIDLLFDLIHEYGHILLGPPNGCEKKYCWEYAAWGAGWRAVAFRFEKLLALEGKYEARKTSCLKSYKKVCNRWTFITVAVPTDGKWSSEPGKKKTPSSPKRG